MIAEILIEKIEGASSEEKVENVANILQNEDITEIVVLENGRYIHMLREIDIMSSLKNRISEITTEREGYFAYEEEHFLKSLHKMHVNDLSMLPVVDKNMTYLGALRKESVLDYLCEQYAVSESDSIIIIEQGIRDYSLATISRIVEEEGGKVLGVFIGTAKGSKEKIWVSLTIQTTSLNKTVASLERHEYQIIAHMSAEENQTIIKERYESLMTFLNV
tara:strand:+ start:15154 stop:15810 length:657 start_codon:yes stop_codon:yes gene_type:complete